MILALGAAHALAAFSRAAVAVCLACFGADAFILHAIVLRTVRAKTADHWTVRSIDLGTAIDCPDRTTDAAADDSAVAVFADLVLMDARDGRAKV
jgi:hypothetical protein